MGVNKIINSLVVNKLKICDLKSSRSLKYTAIIIIAITARVTLYINQNIILIFNFGCETGLEPGDPQHNLPLYPTELFTSFH